MVGTTLLHYRIVRPLGSGGMGEVYAAHDTKLNRMVALKILPASLAGDVDRLLRFQREAQAVAALNHPNVVTLFAVEESAGTHFLTMELVEGTTLLAKIRPGGLALGEWLRLAIPLTDAIAAAHAQGVVHRDLKPANVMITSDGRIKVLDFGLAKLRPDVPAETQALTAMPLTQPQQVFGTPQYMSPEQIEGRIVDHRTDIFSLGVILYELACGARPFSGASATAIMSSVLRDAPAPLATVRPDLPSEVERIVRRCLQKDAGRRYQQVLDLKLDLEELQSTLSSPPQPGAARRSWISRAAVTAALLAVMLAGYAAYGVWRSRAPEGIPEASFRQITSAPAAELFSSISPDGKWIVYAGEGTGNRDVYLQSTSGETAINLTRDSADDDEQPAFSPDGEQIAFRSSREGGGLFVMGRTGERVRRITRAGFNPAWSPDGRHVAYTSIPMELRPQNSIGKSELWIAAVDGSEAPRMIYDGDATMPNWSPDGSRIAFNQSLSIDRHVSVLTIAAAGGEPVLVEGGAVEIAWNPVWSPDGRYLYFISNRGGSPNIWRVGIDQASGVPRGTPQPITTPAAVVAHLSMAANGRQITYSAITETQNIQRLPFDPIKGEVVGSPVNVTTGSRFWANPDPSPDGRQVTFYSQIQPEGDLYIINADGTGLRQLTADKATDRMPRWSPDGQWIACFSDRDGHLEIWKIRPDGSDLAQITTGGEWAYSVWSPDSTRLASGVVVDSAKAGEGNYFKIFDPNLPASQPSERISINAPGYFAPNSWSRDGRAIVGQPSISKPSVAVFKIGDRSYTQVADYGEWPVWLPDSRRVLFVSKRREFHVFDTVARTGRVVFAVSRDTLGPPKLTLDGRTAFFSRRVTEADIWIAELK